MFAEFGTTNNELCELAEALGPPTVISRKASRRTGTRRSVLLFILASSTGWPAAAQSTRADGRIATESARLSGFVQPPAATYDPEPASLSAACAAARRASGTRNGEHDT